MNIQLNPNLVLKALITIVFILLVAHIGSGLLYGGSPSTPGARTLYRLFNLNQEQNIPTFFSSLNLLFSAVLLLLIGYMYKMEGASVAYWLGLALVFCFLSIDEAVSIHETMNGFARNNFGIGGLLYFGWVVPYGIGLMVLLYIFVPFLRALPKDISILFLMSGFIFSMGAIGFEMLGGLQKDINGQGGGKLYHITYSVEEILEMLGVSFFNFSLVKYLSMQPQPLSISIGRIKKEGLMDLEKADSQKN